LSNVVRITLNDELNDIVKGFYILIREATGMSEVKYSGNFFSLFLIIGMALQILALQG